MTILKSGQFVVEGLRAGDQQRERLLQLRPHAQTFRKRSRSSASSIASCRNRAQLITSAQVVTAIASRVERTTSDRSSRWYRSFDEGRHHRTSPHRAEVVWNRVVRPIPRSTSAG